MLMMIPWCSSRRSGLRTGGQSVVSSSNSSRTADRTRCDPPKRKVPQLEKWARRAGPAVSSRPPPAPPRSPPSPAAPRPFPYGVRRPSLLCQIPCLPPPPACRGPTPWPTPRRRGTARATPAPPPTSGEWTAPLTSLPCTTSSQARARPSARWARTRSQAISISHRRPSPPRATGRPAWASTPQQTAWIIRTKRRRGSWTSMPIAWIIRIRRPRGNSRSCEQNSRTNSWEHPKKNTRSDCFRRGLGAAVGLSGAGKGGRWGHGDLWFSFRGET